MNPQAGTRFDRLRVAFWSSLISTPVRLLGGAWRLAWGHCPLCNSDAPLLDHCPCCMGDRTFPLSKEQKARRWKDYLFLVNLMGKS